MTRRKTGLTITVIVFLQYKSDPELVHHAPPNEHQKPSGEFQETSNDEEREPVPAWAGGREHGDEG